MSEVAMSHDQRIALYRAQIERDANFTACHDVIGRLVNAMIVIDQLQALVKDMEAQIEAAPRKQRSLFDEVK